jgi:hypothetical protein
MAHYMVHEIEKTLDTRDKRYMFIKLLFPDELPLINLEGTPRETALNIVDRFIKNDLICDLEHEFFKHFKTL